MHTTTWTDPDSTNEYRVHHNQDFSGETFVVVSSRVATNIITYGDGRCEITFPGALLVSLARNAAIDELITKLEAEYR